MGVLLYYARAVNTKILVNLIKIGSQQATATENKNEAIAQPLYCVATYPNNGITYQSSNMILDGHSDAAYLNVSKYFIQAGSHIFLSKDDPVPRLNGSILTISQTIESVMSSATEAELASLFVTSKAMVQIRQTLIEMGWPQPKTPVQKDNSKSTGVTNKNIVKIQLKSMEMRL